MNPLEKPQDYDVICRPTNDKDAAHVGNKRFAVMVYGKLQGKYEVLHSSQERLNIANQLVQIVRSCEPGGRFLELCTGTDGTKNWDVLDDERAVTWVKEFIDNETPNTPRPRRASADMTFREMETSVARAPSHGDEGSLENGFAEEGFEEERAPERRRSIPRSDPAREEMIKKNPELVKILIKQTGIFHHLVGDK